MRTLPQHLPCFTTSEEYGPLSVLRELPRGVYCSRTPEQQAAYEADYKRRMDKLGQRLDEIFATPEGQRYLRKGK